MMNNKELLKRDNKLLEELLEQGIVKDLEALPVDKRLLKVYTYLSSFMNPKSEIYLLFALNQRVSLGFCPYFKLVNNYDNVCTAEGEYETLCNGFHSTPYHVELDTAVSDINRNIIRLVDDLPEEIADILININEKNYTPGVCVVFRKKSFIGELNKRVDSNDLENYFSYWISEIANRYTPSRIDEHLKKHLKEDGIKSYDWFVSADNLLDILLKVKGADKCSEKAEEYKRIISEYKRDNNIILIDKINKLFEHFMKHPSISRSFPLF